MTLDEFSKNFGVLVDATNGVRTLRRMILELAIRGKLAYPDPLDESASTLLSRIAKVKTKQKRPKASINYDEELHVKPPFELPHHWQWTRLDNLADRVNYGTSAKPTEDPHGIAVLRMNNLQGGRIVFTPLKYVARETDGIDTLILSPGDILFNRTNSYELVGKTAVFLEQQNTYTFASYLIRVSVLTGLQSARFLNLYFCSPTFRTTQIEPGIVQQNGQANFNSSKLRSVWVPTPPLQEQQRIVAEVDKLMARCDELEARQTKKRETGSKLTQSAMEALSSAAGTDEFAKAWKRVSDNFQVLLDRREHVVELRKAILGLAIHGRLEQQRYAEEDATTLLKRIAQDRVHARSQHARGVAAPVAEGEARIGLPRTWRWAPVGSFASCVLGKMLDKSKHTKGLLRPYLRNINVRWGGFDLSDLLSMYFEDDELERYGVRTGDVLICEGGEPGRAAVWRDGSSNMLIQKAIHRVRLEGGIVPEWLIMNLRYDSWTGRLADYFTGATIKHFTGQALTRYQVRLAPVAEQKRIVARVDQLLAMCDTLESKLRDAEHGAQRLAEAMVAEMVA